MPKFESCRKKILMSRGAGSSPSFSPTNISGLIFWLDASDTGTVTESSGDVSQWDDKSGNGHDFVQATAINQPVYTPNSQNGLHTVDFSAGQTTTMDTPSEINTGANANFTLYFVMNHGLITNTTPTEVAYGINVTSINPRFTMQLGPASGSIANEVITYAPNDLGGSTQRQYTQTNIPAGLQIHTIGYRESDDTTRMQLNGSDLTILSQLGGFDLTHSLFGLDRIGANPTPGTPFYLNGNLCEWFAYDSFLSDNDNSRIVSYLVDKWIGA